MTKNTINILHCDFLLLNSILFLSIINSKIVIAVQEDYYMKSKVYFTKTISPEKVLDLYKLLDKKLDGNVAIKLHSGEVGNQNFLKPDFFLPADSSSSSSSS